MPGSDPARLPAVRSSAQQAAGALARATTVAPAIFAGSEYPEDRPPGAGQDTVEWRIELAGRAGGELTLEFGRAVACLEGVQIEGPGTWLSESLLTVPLGRTIVRGLPVSPDGTPLSAVPRFSFAREPSSAALGPLRVTIQQVASDTQVGGYAFEVNPPGAAPSAAGGDRLDLTGKNDAEPGLLVLEGHLFQPPSKSDRVLAVPAAGSDLENLRSADKSPSEAMVFSRSNAMASKRLTWTPAPGETRSIGLKPPRVVPVRVWIVRLFDVAFDTESVELQATTELALANAIYRENGVGVRFDGAVTDVHVNLAAECGESMTELWKHYKPKTLNIYYVNPISGKKLGGTVQTESGKLRNTILVFPAAKEDTLAHELGHALRLSIDDHSEKALPDDNIMSDGICRRHLTLGQAYWANASTLSAVNRLASAGVVREFEDNPWPALELDADRPWVSAQDSTRGDTRVPLDAGGSADRALYGWLNSDDGGASHLEALARLARPEQRPVLAPLDAMLRRGPSNAALERYRRHLARSRASIGDAALSEEAYIRLYEKRFVARSQARAAVALARIGGDEAAASLRSALHCAIPDHVRQRVIGLLGRGRRTP